MSEEKQIDEMQEVLEDTCDKVECKYPFNCDLCHATLLYNAGYRKQSEGEWIKDEKSKFEHRYNCPVCNYRLLGIPTNYCPNCGAKMKGGAE